MNLRKYLDKHGIKITFFASEIGVRQPQLSQWLSGKGMPNVVNAVRIERATKGLVKCSDWIDDPM